MDKIKTRILSKNNYKGIFYDGKTMRISLNPKKLITELIYPEFYDVKITNKCNGKCNYCYQSSLPTESHFKNIKEKIKSFFETLTKNDRPFQVAIGGGNPNEHPDFIKILKSFYNLGIVPNYSTNGMGLSNEIIKATKKYCGGVALSCHSHLKKYWNIATKKLYDEGIKLNFHIIISNKNSLNRFKNIFDEYKDRVNYFVLLPYICQGRATSVELISDKKLLKILLKLNSNQIAYGANYYPFLLKNRKYFDLSLYEPEIFSKYLDMGNMKLYASSFSRKEIIHGYV